MAASTNPAPFGASVLGKIQNSKILVVGSGGIGCELLKNLVLSGFPFIHIVDLDTIEFSNLNRQFLFQKQHVGRSKAEVARESVLQINPNAHIEAFHDSITSPKYDVDYYQQFNLVLNALDNRAARIHVNRMCLAADIPLIESGTAGYLGQVTVIKKGRFECYECSPPPHQKTFPSCTIRNTPSQPIHCVVWAKHLLNQLFGEPDEDQDVSPDVEDPELVGESGSKALETDELKRKSTRMWAEEVEYSSEKLFNKLFHEDIRYLLSMEDLWKSRKPPAPVAWNSVFDQDTADSSDSAPVSDTTVWPFHHAVRVFAGALTSLRNLMKKSESTLVWDKDDDDAMDFVAATANIRAAIFGIPLKSRFELKSMAGNIIPAIATTNAIVAGLIVLEAFKVLDGKYDDCRAIFVKRLPQVRKKLLVPCFIGTPNPKCYVCSEKPLVDVLLNVNATTIEFLQNKILKEALGMIAPDVEIDDDRGTIIISSEPGETEDNNEKYLAEFNIKNGTRLKCDDFLQQYNLVLVILHSDTLEKDQPFKILSDTSNLNAAPEKPVATEDGEDDDMCILEDQPSTSTSAPRKRKIHEPASNGSKRAKHVEVDGIEDN